MYPRIRVHNSRDGMVAGEEQEVAHHIFSHTESRVNWRWDKATSSQSTLHQEGFLS